MKRSKNVPLIILVILLGSFSFWFIVNKKKGTIGEELRDFAINDTSSITKIFLADKSGKQVTLKKIKPGTWRVNDKYYVRNDAINLLLSTMKNIKVKEPVGKKARNNTIKQFSVVATKVEAYVDEKLVKEYYVGTETQDQMGTYMLMVDEKSGRNSEYPFITFIPGFEGYLTPRYFTNEEEWRDKVIFRYRPDEIRSIKMEYPVKPSESFVINLKSVNEYELLTLSDNKSITFNPMAVKQYLSYFKNVEYEWVEDKMSRSKRDSVLNNTPLNIITVTDVKGTVNQIKCYGMPPKPGQHEIGGKTIQYDPDRFYGIINGEKEIVVCQYFVFGKLMQGPGYFSGKAGLVKK